MNTTAAAETANVTIPTIRRWCRTAQITATKISGRWTIDETSLEQKMAARTAKTKAPQPRELTVENLIAIGGSLWERNGMRRVYINEWRTFAGLELSFYNTGNICGGTWQGEGVSNSQAGKLAGCIEKLWFDADDGLLHCRYGWSESRVASKEEVLAAATAGIRAAVNAL